MWKRIIGAIAFTVFFGFISFIVVGFSLLFSTQNGYIYVGIIAAIALVTGNLFILGVLSRLSKKLKIIVPALLFALPLLGYSGYEAYMKYIEIENAEVDLTAYEPYKDNTDVAQLEKPAEFQIKEDLPILDGATALYPVFSAFVQTVYPEDSYPHDRPSESKVTVSKTNVAYERLAKGDVDMIFVAGPSSTQRLELGDKMKLTAIGKEAFVFFVHKSNPVNSLTIEELQKIYSGEITNWQEVGGRNQKIIAFQRPEGSGSQTGLQNIMGNIPIMDPPTDQRVSGMGGVIEKASNYRNHRNAIGFSYRYFATQMVEDKGIKLLEINNVKPDVHGIQSGEYPLTADFYSVTNGSDNPHIESFNEWILSEQGQKLIEKTGYVPIQ